MSRPADFYTPGALPSTQGIKNKLMNGCFRIWQRATSQTAVGYGSDDRWYNHNAGTTKTHSRIPFTPGQTIIPGNPIYASRTIVASVTGASNYCQKSQSIEGVETFAGEICTLSFWANADAPKNLAIDILQNFGTGGSPSAVVYVSEVKVALTTIFQKFVIQFSIPSISSKVIGTDKNDALRLRLWFDAGTDFAANTVSLGHQSGTFTIAQVQLEKGLVATEFEDRFIGDELILCQRFYEKSYIQSQFPGGLTSTLGSSYDLAKGTGFSSGQQAVNIRNSFAVIKRATPTISIYNHSTGASNEIRSIASGAATTATHTVTEVGVRI